MSERLRIPPSEFRRIAHGVCRPEHVVIDLDGRVYASDMTSAVALIGTDGSISRIGAAGGAPNGMAMDRRGRIVIANFGVYTGEAGPLQRLDLATGEISTLVSDVSGRLLTSCNFPVIDAYERIWCTHSTSAGTWFEALDGRADGFVFRLDPNGQCEIVADGLQFPNGCALSADGMHLFVCQTTGRNVLRFPILANGMLGEPQQYGPLLGNALDGQVSPQAAAALSPEARSRLGYTDGCNFDGAGNLWVTLPPANRIVAITPDGDVVTVVSDPSGEVLNHPTNISWGGVGLDDLYVGSLYADYVLQARSPVPGQPLLHQQA